MSAAAHGAIRALPSRPRPLQRDCRCRTPSTIRPYDVDLNTTVANLTPLPSALRPCARAAFSAVAGVANLQFVEVPHGCDTSVVLRLRGDASRKAGIAAYTHSGANSDNVIGVQHGSLDSTSDEDIEHVCRHEVLHAPGFCHPFEGCTTKRTLSKRRLGGCLPEHHRQLQRILPGHRQSGHLRCARPGRFAPHLRPAAAGNCRFRPHFKWPAQPHQPAAGAGNHHLAGQDSFFGGPQSCEQRWLGLSGGLTPVVTAPSARLTAGDLRASAADT